MPKSLTETQKMTAEALLKGRTPHIKISQEVKCSIAQVKKMSMNLNKYGSIVAPKFGKRGRPPIVTCEMRDVHWIFLLFDPLKAEKSYRPYVSLLRISLIYIETNWPISLQKSSMCMYQSVQSAECSNKRGYLIKRYLLTCNGSCTFQWHYLCV